MPIEMHVQPADVAMCSSLIGNTDQMPVEIHVQPVELALCSSLSDNTDQMPIETHVQPADVAMCSSLSGNTDQMPIEIHVQPVELALCSSLSGNTDQFLWNMQGGQKRQWSKEVAAVMRHFEGHIRKGRLATMIECKQCKTAEHCTQADRFVQNIRDLVRNRGVTVKKKENS